MSGYKYIQITQNQWNDVQSRLSTARRESDEMRRQLENERRAAQERERNLAQTSQREISALNARLAQQLQQQQAQLVRQQQSLQQEMNRRLEQQATELVASFNNELETVRTSFGQAIDEIQAQMEREQRDRTAIAQFWLNEYRTLLTGIKTERRHCEQYRAGQLAIFEEQIAVAESLMTQSADAAIALLTSQFAALSQFRNELIIYENECLALYNLANERLLNLLNQAQADMTAQFELDGESFEANIDYWTNGKLSSLLVSLRELQERLQSGDALAFDALQGIIQNISELGVALSELENEAESSFSASEARIRTMQDIADALGEHGWRLEESIFVVDGHATEDEKGDLRSRFVDLTGEDEIILTVGDSKIDIDQFLGSTRNEDVTRANGEVIGEALEESGLCQRGGGHPTTGRGYENSVHGRNDVRSSFRKD